MLTLRRRWPSLLVLAALAGCTAPAPVAPPVDIAALKTAIQARQSEWSAAFLAADAAAIAALYAEDAATIPASGDWERGRDRIARSLQPILDSIAYTAREDITEEVIPLGNDYVFEIGHFSATGTAKADGSPSSMSGRYMALWRKDPDGVWRVLRDIGAPVPSAP